MHRVRARVLLLLVASGLLAPPALAGPGAASATLIVPIVLSSHGSGGAFYVSDLALTNRGTSDAALTLRYVPAFGGGGGVASDTLPAGRQRIVPDALVYLRSLDPSIAPASGDRGGTLRVTFSGLSTEDDAAITVRTTSAAGPGRAGVAYRAVPASRALTGTSYLCGLRQDGRDRSNAAVLNAGAETDGPVTLRLTAVSGDPAVPTAHVFPDVTLLPGGFAQLSGLLGTAGIRNGFVTVERVAGTAPYLAYAVVNDETTSDGSFVSAVTGSRLAGVARLTLPVVLETDAYASELILTNVSGASKSLRLTYVAPAIAGGSTTFSLDLAPGEQKVVPDLVADLRARGTPGIGPAGEDFVGPLFVSVASGDAAGLFVAARTVSRGSGRYGVLAEAVPFGEGSSGPVWLHGLRQDEESRTNLALVNTGELGGTSDTFRVELFDGETSRKAATVDGLEVAPRGFLQLPGLLSSHAPGVTNGYARVTRTAGSNPFVAYAVVNDGARPGERTGDGAFVPMEREVSDPFPEAFGVFATFTDEFVEFRKAMGLSLDGYRSWAGSRLRDLGATWTRSNLQLVWDLVEPVVGGSFDWNASLGGEGVFGAASANGVHYLGVFHEGSGPKALPGRGALRNPLESLPAWQRFVRAAVERYDGDGIDDAPGGIVVKHWQVGNETGGWSATGRTPSEYVRWFEAAAAAVRAADPEARLVLIASTDGASVDPLHSAAIAEIGRDGVRLDAVDLHHWKTAGLPASRIDAAPAYRNLLDASGLPGTELWSCEHGTYVGKPVEAPGTCSPACASGQACSHFGVCVPRCSSNASCPAALPVCDTSIGLCVRNDPEQNQLDQARSLVYRWTVNRALGVKRILWNNLAGWRCFGGGCGSYFDRLGLVADGWGPGESAADVGKPRLSYFSFRMLAERTDGAFAEPLGEVATGDVEVHAYGYRDRATRGKRLLAWADRGKTAVLEMEAPRAELTSLVTDGSGTPRRREVVPVTNGRLSTTLDPDPVWLVPLEE